MTPRRFQPTRAGIVNLWDYTQETFAFANGRLVLRGANGSGKTKALEVLFPFVLDGRLDARRLDPFSGENRTMKENLLWRGVDANHGYAWIEFGDGVRHVTVGVGLRAQRHQPTPTAWFFVADGRVGDEITLVDPDGRPRTKAALSGALGDGTVVERSSEHRRRVDAALFGLGAERYESMLDLVLTLRRPMLAKDLDPRSLSDTLTRGLRSLDDELLERVARSFDDLDAVQRDLDRLAAADDAAQRFLTDYRGYLRTQARHRADAAIEAVAAMHAAEERLVASHRQLDEARASEAITEAELAAVRDRLGADRARHDALRASDAFRTAAHLEHLERAVRDLAAAVDRAAAAAEAAEARRGEREGERDAADAALAAARSEVDRVRPRLATSAATAGVPWAPDDADGEAKAVRERVRARSAARSADVDAVRARFDAVADAERRLVLADEVVVRAEEALARSGAQLTETDAAVVAARGALADEVTVWGTSHAGVLAEGDLVAVLAAVEAVGDDDAAGPLEVWRGRLDPRRSAAEAERARLEQQSTALGEQEAALDGRRQAILDERDDAPPSLPWRAGRDDRAGAPLWRLIRFAHDVDPAHAAGIEAALEAAGLLDAWVTPDGAMAAGALDGFLCTAGGGAGDQLGGSLADVFVPEDQPDVPVAVVQGVLGAVRLGAVEAGGDTAAAIGVDGRYRLGPLSGAHAVAAPRYIGATARSAHRAARVAALDAELLELRTEAGRVADRRRDVERWFQEVAAATAALPRPTALVERLRARDRAAGQHQQARSGLDDARSHAEEARRETNDRRLALQREAQARSVAPTAEGLAAAATALDRFVADGTELAAALDLRAARAEAAAGAARRLADAEADGAARRVELTDRRREHDARSVELVTLRDRMGVDIEAVLGELAAVDAAITGGEAEERGLTAAAQDAAAARGQAEGEVRAATESVATAAGAAEEARRRLAVLCRADVAGPLGLAAPADDTPPVLLDAVDALVVGVSASEERRKAAQTRVIAKLEELEHTLGSAYRPAWDLDDDLIVVAVADDLGVRAVGAFADGLATQRAELEALLTARERAVFEDALLTSVCAQLHARIQATRDLVAAMDAEMRARRLSSGQTVGVAWRADDTATPEWKAVHRLLDQDPAHFGPDQIELLRRHFAAEIKAARSAEPQAAYRDLLARVLDYRTWRRFELALVEPDGREGLLTRARHARLSGGEKAASLHLPLFAAAHAAFAGARPTCPRLLALDEAFAGIDDLGRSELLSLTVAFDLDLFMTGYDLWAIDATVPAVAHYDLLHLVDDHAVSSLLVLWNGRELVEGPDAEVELAALTSS